MRIGHWIPAYRGLINANAVRAIAQDHEFCGQSGFEWDWWWSETSSIVKARNEALKRALQTECDYLLMQDADCCILPGYGSMVERLLATMSRHNATACGAVFMCRGREKMNAEPALPGQIYGAEIGTGSLLIDCRKVAEIDAPWFVHEFSPDGTETTCGEDIYFSRLLRRAGHTVVADYTFPTGHVGELMLRTDEILHATRAEIAEPTTATTAIEVGEG